MLNFQGLAWVLLHSILLLTQQVMQHGSLHLDSDATMSRLTFCQLIYRPLLKNRPKLAKDTSQPTLALHSGSG